MPVLTEKDWRSLGMRYVWVRAAEESLRRLQFRAAREAWRNSRKASPPDHWKSGVAVLGQYTSTDKSDDDLPETQPQRDVFGTARVSTWRGRIYPVELKEPSPIKSWKDWPDDVRETLRDWNRGKGLSFRGWQIFKCPDCEWFCKPQKYGTACLNGVHICDDCLIDRVRNAGHGQDA